MSADYLEILETDLLINALANREQVEGDGVVRTLLAWTNEIDDGILAVVPHYGDQVADDISPYRWRAAALVVACVLGVTSTGVAVAVGAHPFHPVVRLLKHMLNPDSVHPLSGRAAVPGGQALRVRSVVGRTATDWTSAAVVSRSDQRQRISRDQAVVRQAAPAQP